MDGFLTDLRIVCRQLWACPGFTVAAVAPLALGIGITTALFSVVQGVLLRPLPFPEAHELVALCETHPSTEGFCVASPPTVTDWARESTAFESMGLGRDWPFELGSQDGARRVRGAIATPGFFRTLGIVPDLGRLFEIEDLGEGRAVVLSHDFWRNHFGGDPGVLGRELVLDGEPCPILGVLPRSARIPHLERAELWRVLPLDPTDEKNRSWRGFLAFGRLAPGMDSRRAQEELGGIRAGLARQFPDAYEGWSVAVEPLHEQVVGPVRPMLRVLSGTVTLVLLIGCAGVAHLFLARTAGRRGELAVRMALGASRGRLVRLLLMEGLLLASAAGAAGWLLAMWATHLFLGLAPGGIPRLENVSFDHGVLGFAAGISIGTAIVFSLIPALHAARRKTLDPHLREARATRSEGRFHAALVIAEVAAAMILLAGAGLLARSFGGFLSWQPGFETERLATTWLISSPGTYAEGETVARLHLEAARAVEALPTVETAGLASAGPLFGGRETGSFRLDGGGEDSRGAGGDLVARWFDVGPGYFETLGLPILHGRRPGPEDRAGAPSIAVVNQTFARRLAPGRATATVVGQRIVEPETGRRFEIVGVVRDIEPLEPGTAAEPEIYWPYLQRPRWAAHLVVRTRGEPEQAFAGIRQRLAEVAPHLGTSSFRTLAELRDRRLVEPRFSLSLVGLFAAVALVLAAVGVYGVLAYSLARRRREIAIRVSLGASPSSIRGRWLVRGAGLALLGVAVGIGGALALSRFLSSLLHGVPATDPATYLASGIFFLLVALVACFLPAHRASRIDPAPVLRGD